MRKLCLALTLFISHSLFADGLEAYLYKKPAPQKARLAIIIDDIGYNIPLGQRTVDLQAPLTLAVLPKTPGAIKLAEAGYQSGKEIMLHAPMSNHNGKDLGPGGLTPDMSHEEFISTLIDSLTSIPHVQGVNNHMGSELTTKQEQMTWLMAELKKHNLYFIDSLTNGSSVALKEARKAGVTSQERDIFLDHIQEEEAIKKAFDKLLARAEKNGYAIGIGHPYEETLNVLEQNLHLLEEKNIELVHVSKLLNHSKIKDLSYLRKKMH